MSSHGPSSESLLPTPPFMQMPSSPASMVLFTMSTFLQQLMSRASPFCAFQGQRMVVPSTMTLVQRVGMRWKRGEFWIVTPLTSTRSQSVRRMRWLLRRSCACGVSARLSKWVRLNGNQSLPPSVSVPPIDLYSFHSTSLTLERFTGRHMAPLPSMVPSPVMLMLVRLLAEMSGEVLSAFAPLETLKCCERSGVAMITAFFSIWRSMLSLSEMRPVSHTPAGTMRWPPPFLSRALMALSKAWVLRVIPSPTAPKSFRFTL